MIASIKGLKHAPSHFSIDILPQYLNAKGQLVCSPGSVFEGLVKLNLSESLSFERLKVVFKATERVNYDAMGWEKIKNDDGRLFAVRTTLLGRHVPDTNVLEAGEHVYPFAIELPLVNYPPSIDHHLIGTTFVLVASIERSNNYMFRSEPYFAYFRPTLPSRSRKPLTTLSEHIATLNPRISAHLSLPSLEYNLFDTNRIPLTLTLLASQEQHLTDTSLQQLHISLKQTITIVHKTFTRTETTTIHHIDPRITADSISANSLSSLSSRSSSSSASSSSLTRPQCAMIFTCHLDLNHKHLLLPTVDYSTRFKVDYMLLISVRTRHGPLSSKKKLFQLPIHFGTLPPGTLPDASMKLYTDEQVITNTGLTFKPKFLRPLNHPLEFLPAYDELVRPPSYHSQLLDDDNNSSSHTPQHPQHHHRTSLVGHPLRNSI